MEETIFLVNDTDGGATIAVFKNRAKAEAYIKLNQEESLGDLYIEETTFSDHQITDDPIVKCWDYYLWLSDEKLYQTIRDMEMNGLTDEQMDENQSDIVYIQRSADQPTTWGTAEDYNTANGKDVFITGHSTESLQKAKEQALFIYMAKKALKAAKNEGVQN